MRLLRKKTAQSMIEYAILLAVVISAFLLLQAIIKRGVSGGLNEAAGRFGDQYSVTNTSTVDQREAVTPQIIIEETGTSDETGGIDDFLAPLPNIVAGDLQHAYTKGAHNVTTRKGQDMRSATRSETDAAKEETYRVIEATGGNIVDFGLSYPRILPSP